jgi:hypothetical protein
MTGTAPAKARWWPRKPPKLPGEDSAAYTNRLIGCTADGTPAPGDYPYDHPRNRQCSIGFHDECSENRLPELATDAELRASDRSCHCPHHTTIGRLELRVDVLEEGLVAAWSLAGEVARQSARAEFVKDEVGEIVKARPEYAEWYLARPA